MASTSSNNRNKRLEIQAWSSSAEEVMGNKDLLILILLRVPARSLIRFKSVNRKWRYLILDTKFAREHVGVNPKPPISGLYFCTHPRPIPLQGHSLPLFAFTGKPEQSQGFYHIHDSRHGLILCSYFYYNNRASLQIVVCNPTTQKHRLFPEIALKMHRRIRSSHLYISFDPSVSLIYKLIYIRYDMPKYEVGIYTSDYSTKKIIHLEAGQLWGPLLHHGFLASDGIIYMMTANHFLVEFDVDKEKLSAARMTYTPKFSSKPNIGYFGEKDAGNLVAIASRKCGLDFMIYEMAKLEGRKWVKKHHIDFTQELQNLPAIERPIHRRHFAVMYVFWDDKNEERDLTLVIGVPGRAIFYNHSKKKTEVICDLRGHESFDWESYSRVHPFVGSLCSI